MRYKSLTMDSTIRYYFQINNIDLLYTDCNVCWPWIGGLNEHGYGRLRVQYPNGKSIAIYAHRVSFMLYNNIDFLAAKQFVLHSCDNPPCVNPEHLFLGNQLINIRDMHNKNRGTYGESHWNTFLTIAQVNQLKSDRKLGMTYGELGDKYNCSPSTARSIVVGDTWIKS